MDPIPGHRQTLENPLDYPKLLFFQAILLKGCVMCHVKPIQMLYAVQATTAGTRLVSPPTPRPSPATARSRLSTPAGPSLVPWALSPPRSW
jgi:hypothetical protein